MEFPSRASVLAFSVLLLSAWCYGQQGVELSQTCLGCICEAASGCNTTVGCNGEVCGPFRITYNYWADSGKPTLDDGSSNDGYSKCANDPYCAARTVNGYMARFGQDCTGDGKIDCDDYVRIHRLGGYGCNGGLDNKYENTYRLCMQTFG